MDIKFAFPNGVLKEEVYIEQPIYYVIQGIRRQNNKAENDSLQVKQSLRMWNSLIDKYLLENNFTKCPHEYALYVKIKE